MSRVGAQSDCLRRCLVYCRLRPTHDCDNIGQDGVRSVVEVSGGQARLDGKKVYNFDGTFDPDSRQEDVFEVVAKPSIEHALRGSKTVIMVYGQAGTGKSFTMSHMQPGHEGIIPRCAAYLFERIEQSTTKKIELSAQFVQIYRDTVSSVLGGDSKTDVKFDAKKGVDLVNCTRTQINTEQDFLDMHALGDSRRVVRVTDIGTQSSRGHTALVLHVKCTPTDPSDTSKPTKGKITFVDLAGYERFGTLDTMCPLYKDEAKKINTSLMSLGHVVTSLSKNEQHIPWRDTKLTRLLQDSIGGKSRASIIINIGPSSAALCETMDSLDFGNRAMAVKVPAGRRSAAMEHGLEKQQRVKSSRAVPS